MEITISLPHGDQRMAVTGTAEQNLKIIRESLGVNIVARNGNLKISGDSNLVQQATHVVKQLTQASETHHLVDRQRLLEMLAQVGQQPIATAPGHAGQGRLDPEQASNGIDVYLQGRRIRPMTDGQRRYLHAIHSHDLTFCCGPAGTGKIYLAVAAAAAMLKRGEVRKIVLARPAVEAGEKLGFLPGTLQDKVNPYLRPLLDALYDTMEFDQVQRFIASDLIEITPLAFMRGRTLNDAMVILDEAQNTTRQQMLMFLTRMGHGSRIIVTGDTTQIDLADVRDSGLIDAARRLKRVPGIAFETLDKADIVRHNLVQRIVEAYDQNAKAPTTSP